MILKSVMTQPNKIISKILPYSATIGAALDWWDSHVTNEDKNTLTIMLIGAKISYKNLSEQEILKIYKYCNT
jgi:hypothetical protein